MLCVFKESIIMKKELHINVKIWDYWISWTDDDYRLYMILEIDNKLYFIERFLEDS